MDLRSIAFSWNIDIKTKQSQFHLMFIGRLGDFKDKKQSIISAEVAGNVGPFQPDPLSFILQLFHVGLQSVLVLGHGP